MAHLALLSISLLSSTIFFLYGFFPMMSPTNVANSSRDSLPLHITSHNPDLTRLELNPELMYRKHVDKLVFIVIDGLRYDFVSEKSMKYTMSRIEENRCLVKVEVSSPTVTMPRLKSLMTGAISKYIDVILNFGATQISSDSLIHQLNTNNMRTTFYGDDTWLKLFPADSFVRYEGTSSFYVSDYTEVDDNVTRNVLEEMRNPQSWDVMVLHYLGLDHIGHIENSFSPLIHTKLEEMDSIVEFIHEGLILNKEKHGENFLLVVTGDHGMRDMGGHGGSTKPETIVPLVTLGNDCTRDKTDDERKHETTERRISLESKANALDIDVEDTASQVDVTATLAVLLGIPIPACNTGKLIPKLLLNLTLSELLYAYYYNTKQISNSYFGDGADSEANQVFSEYYNLLLSKFPSELQVLATINSFAELLTRISSHITRSSSLVDTYVVISALVLSVLTTLVAILEPNLRFLTLPILCMSCLLGFVNSFSISSIPLNIFMSYFLSIQLNSIWEVFRVKLEQLLSLSSSSQDPQCLRTYFRMKTLKESLFSKNINIHKTSEVSDTHVNTVLILLSGMTILCSLSTSYIENEHNVWMFVLNTFLFYILLVTKHRSKQCAILVLLILHRLLRCINMKWLDEEASVSHTLSYWFTKSHPLYLTVFYSLSMISVYFVCYCIENNTCDKLFTNAKFRDMSSVRWSRINTLLITASMAGSYLYKTISYSDYTVLVATSSIIFYIVFKSFQYSNSSSNCLKSLQMFTSLLSVLLFKPYNTVLISSLYLSSYLIASLFPTNTLASTLLHMWLGRAYYFLQGSTNSIATIDITVGYVGQSSYNSTIAGVLIYFNMYALNFLALFLLFAHHTHRQYYDIVRIHLKYISINLTFYLFIVYLQRHHLFIWSVFSPKLLLLSSYNVGNIFVSVIPLFYFLQI